MIDSAAALAVLYDEPGAERVRPLLEGASMSSVNATEVVTRLQDGGETHRDAVGFLNSLSLRIVDFSIDQALTAAKLRDRTRHRGLSLGDRACLALAIRENATAVTADRAWADLDIGCAIEVIR